MAYDPKIHHRKSIRLEGFDYSQAGLYFITICVRDKECLFGEIVGDEMVLNDLGEIAFQQWEKLPGRFHNVELDVFQIMPDHLHGIIILTDPVEIIRNAGIAGAGLAPARNSVIDDEMETGVKARAGASPAPTKTVGDIIGAYKSLVANNCLVWFKQKNPDK